MIRGVRVPTLVGLYSNEKNPPEVGTLTPLNQGPRRPLDAEFNQRMLE